MSQAAAISENELETLVKEGVYSIVYFQAKDGEGELYYIYMAVKLGDLDRFNKAFKGGRFTPNEHGIILECGYGEPDDEVKKLMTEQYGFNHESGLTNVEK